MALLGTWQANSVAAFYGQHIRNFDWGWSRFYVSHITIFNDENDKPSMAIKVSRRPLRTLIVGVPRILPGFQHPPPERDGSDGGSVQEPHTGDTANGVSGVNSVNGVNGVGHGGSPAAHG